MDADNLASGWDWKSDRNDPWLDGMIKHIIMQVLGDGENHPISPHVCMIPDNLNLENLDDFIDGELKKMAIFIPEVPPEVAEDRGIIGSEKVIFDVTSNVGSLVIDRDRLGLSSQSNFSSIRANCCVYKGKWLYELMLNSKGVMQVGWATLPCKFSQEKGVGDTRDSYAYDGTRVRKWNVSTYKYGEPWLTGDVIGCAIDLDEGTVSFYRNGKYLGEAFSNVRIGPGMAYFPAVSLAYNENLVANFGSTPLHYPVVGYSPLQKIPYEEVLKAEKLLQWMFNLLQLYPILDDNLSRNMAFMKGWHPALYAAGSTKGQMMLLAASIIHRLGPLLTSAFVTEACLVPFFFKLNEGFEKATNTNEIIMNLLDIMWALMEHHELQMCLEYLVLALLNGYRFSPATIDFYQQKRYLYLTLAIIQHTTTRHYLLKNVLFDTIKFPVLLQVKPLDDDVLCQLVPDVWLDMGEEHIESDPTRKLSYEMSCSQIKTIVEEVEHIQLKILIQLFKGSDIREGRSSRSIFLAKFREFLKENSAGTRVPVVHLCPFFHRLIALLRFYSTFCDYDMDQTICVPAYIFSRNSDDSLETQRVGGLQSHLLKTFQKELTELADPGTTTSQFVSSDKGSCIIVNRQDESIHLKSSKQDESVHMKGSDDDNSMKSPVCSPTHVPQVPLTKEVPSPPPQPPPDLPSKKDLKDVRDLIDLTDGIIRLYHIAAHRQLEKMCALQDSMQEYIIAIQDIEERLTFQKEDIEELEQAKQVFLNKLIEQGRHYAWIAAVAFSSERQSDVYWLFKTLLRSLHHTSKRGAVFAFIPDFYIEACIKCANTVRTFFHPFYSIESMPDYQLTLVDYGMFLALHFADSRVVNAELKDSLVQALAVYVCHPSTLQALEQINEESRITMTKALLQPYENRAWAQSNWILIRLWKGCGFAFRYAVPPHLSKKANMKNPSLTDSPSTSHQKPCPSPIFLEHISKWLLENADEAAAFLGSILNQLNWAFSEFIGMLQEIQNASNRPERVFIDSRQLKICATCFDLTLGLLRVLEMTVHLVPQLFTDSTRPSSEIFLTRLCQLLCQVLNRVTSKSGCFCLVVSLEIPGLEVVDHFPILSAVTGILICLILDGESQSRECAVNALLSEPSFQPVSLDFLLESAKDSKNPKLFSFRDYEEVSGHEIKLVEALIEHLHSRYKLVQQNRQSVDIDDEAVCTICYANKKSAMFHPCQHESCRSCISLHLLQHKECFFCKSIIDHVQSSSGEKIFSSSKESS